MRLFKQTPNFPLVRLRFVLMGISLALLAFSGFLFFTKGLNYGTDFLGGVKLQYLFPKQVAEGEVRQLLNQLNLGEVSVVRLGDPQEKRLVIKVPYPTQEATSAAEATPVAGQITPKLAEQFGQAGLILELEETVGPKVGSELRRKGILAVLFSLFCILVYVGFRLDFFFAPGAILALFHDVLVTLGIFSLLGLEFDLTILAACLTIVGYSINDSIVVFDRIREHARLITPSTLEEVVNRSLNETLSRTFLTSLTVFFVVVVLYFFGGVTIKGFAFALILGTFFGTFSTFSIVTPVYVGLYRLLQKK